jgi:hypothetical protein
MEYSDGPVKLKYLTFWETGLAVLRNETHFKDWQILIVKSQFFIKNANPNVVASIHAQLFSIAPTTASSENSG